MKKVTVTIDVLQVVAILLAIILAAYGEISWWIPMLFLLWGLTWEISLVFTREGGKDV